MKIQFLNGGLANQAFQYIFAKYYELSHPGEIMYMDDSYFALNTVHNGYELDKVFGIKAHMLSECFDDEVWGFILDQRRQGKSVPQILCENGIEMYMISEVGEGHKTFNPFEGQVVSIPCNQYLPQVLDVEGDVYYHGYWINKNWFAAYKSQFLEEFRFPEVKNPNSRAYLEQIQNTKSVSVHIRRGDYVTLGWAIEPELCQVCIQNFINQMGGVSGKWTLFVFSDDIAWCKEHQNMLEPEQFKDVVFVEGNVNGANYLDMLLMSQCKAMILSNSAFCYLAALLNVNLQYYINPTQREV